MRSLSLVDIASIGRHPCLNDLSSSGPYHPFICFPSVMSTYAT